MNKANKFSPEVRERAVRMVQEHRGEYEEQRSFLQNLHCAIAREALRAHEE